MAERFVEVKRVMVTWEKISTWHFVTPPSRPDIIQLDSINNVLSRISRDSPVVVLGSTPEYRDLLLESGFKNIEVIEKYKSSYQMMSRLLVSDPGKNEKVTWGDWREILPREKNKYSLILSDLTIGNLPYSDLPDFYNNIENALISGGLFVDRILILENPLLSIGKLIRKYEQMPLNMIYANYFSCEFLFCSELLQETETVDSSRIYDTIISMSNSRRIARFVEFSKLITPEDCIWWYGRPWHQIKKYYCPNLILEKTVEEPVETPYYKRAFLHFFRKR